MNDKKRDPIPTQMRMDDISREYREFVDKFKPKKTTDDCYTPVEVYEAIAGWVAEEYGLKRIDFVRPFYPGGDYERYQYDEAAIVVDNPPFSILTQIVDFYERHKIPYFLFAPYLTVLGIRPATCRIVTDQDIKYANGATVNTSFVTNLEPTLIRTAPELARRIDEVQKAQRPPEKPKYSYPDDVLTSTAVGYIGRYGIDYKVMREDAYFIRSMDSQRLLGKAIFGGGYLLSKRAAADRAAADRAAADRAAAELEAQKQFTFKLSPREREIQDQLGGTSMHYGYTEITNVEAVEIIKQRTGFTLSPTDLMWAEIETKTQILQYEDDAETVWRVDPQGRRCHRGIGSGCTWTKWERV